MLATHWTDSTTMTESPSAPTKDFLINNVSGVEIPAYSVVVISSMSITGGTRVFSVTRPTADSMYAMLFTYGHRIPTGTSPVNPRASLDFLTGGIPVKYAGTVPTIGSEVGTSNGLWTVAVGKKGLMVLGVDAGRNLCFVRPFKSRGLPGPITISAAGGRTANISVVYAGYPDTEAGRIGAYNDARGKANALSTGSGATATGYMARMVGYRGYGQWAYYITRSYQYFYIQPYKGLISSIKLRVQCRNYPGVPWACSETVRYGYDAGMAAVTNVMVKNISGKPTFGDFVSNSPVLGQFDMTFSGTGYDGSLEWKELTLSPDIINNEPSNYLAIGFILERDQNNDPGAYTNTNINPDIDAVTYWAGTSSHELVLE